MEGIANVKMDRLIVEDNHPMCTKTIVLCAVIVIFSPCVRMNRSQYSWTIIVGQKHGNLKISSPWGGSLMCWARTIRVITSYSQNFSVSVWRQITAVTFQSCLLFNRCKKDFRIKRFFAEFTLVVEKDFSNFLWIVSGRSAMKEYSLILAPNGDKWLFMYPDMCKLH